MAQEDSGQEKTEEPTERRKQEARNRGNVPLSRDAANVFIFLAAVGILLFTRHYAVERIQACFYYFFSFDKPLTMSAGDAHKALIMAARFLFEIVGPLMAIVFVAAIAANVLQVGFIYAPQKLEMNFDRLNIVKGAKKIFSLRQLVEGGKNVIKLIIIATIAYFAFRRELRSVGILIDASISNILEHIIVTSMKITFQISLFLIALGIVDFAYQRWEHNRSLKMSRQDLKDELKRQEGDPMIKQRIRQAQMQQARQRMMSEVPEASVVVTNPTHLAVAIKYNHGKMNAPQVVAKGAGFIAERIKEIAKTNAVPIVENKPVARVLYKTVKVGQEVPASLYKAIAGILAYVYRTAKKKPRWI